MEDQPTASDPSGWVLQGMDGNWPGVWDARSRSLFLAQRIARLVQDNARRALAPFGLGFTEYEVLCALRVSPPPHAMLPSALYDAVLISSGGLTKVLKALEAGGLITRPRGEGDARTRPVALTAQGIARVEKATAAVTALDAAHLRDAFDAPEAFERLERDLRKVAAALEAGRRRDAADARET